MKARWFSVASVVLVASHLTLPAGFAQQAVDSPPPQPQSTVASPNAAPAESGSAVERFVGANRAYEEGDYERAIELYQGLLREGYDSGVLHYDLGNAYLRNGELGRAIASYRRAEARTPRDRDLLANLAFARQSNKDAIAPPAPSALASTLLFWHYRLGRGELARVTLVLNALFWALLLLRVARPATQGVVGAAVVVGFLLLATGGSLVWRWLAPELVGVVVPQEVGARTAPDAESVVRFNLHAGAEVAVEAEEGDWIRITLPDGQRGWIESRWLEVVRY